MKYQPSDVTTFDIANKFRDCFEDSRWNTIAGSIVVISQVKNEWTSLPYDDYYNPQGMVEAGFLERIDEKYMLTDAAIERIMQKYPKITIDN